MSTSRIISVISILFIIFGVGFILRNTFFADNIEIPSGNSDVSGTNTIVVKDGEVLGNKNDIPNNELEEMEDNITEKEILVTDGVKHIVPLNEIVQGCPGKDCIPSIDNPVYESPDDSKDWLSDDDIGLALSYGGKERFYPYRILVSHEIVNDKINDKRVLITYCPLCFTGIIFDPTIGGEQVEFGVSGKLRNSNLLMYDRKTDSLWSQVTGEAVVGELTGSELSSIPSDVTKFGLWKNSFPNGEVLSRDTGRPFATYSSIPYGGDLTDIKPFFPISNEDNRLSETAFVLGIVIDGQAKAYHFDAVKAKGTITDSFAGKTLKVEYDKNSDAVRIFNITDGANERLVPVPVFWFSWAATHPTTELLK